MESAKPIRFIGLASILLLATGCTICADCDLDSYNAYGGRWQRTDRDAGRVGSLFHPAGVQVPYGPGDANDPNSVLEKSAEDSDAETEPEQDEDGDLRRDGIDFDFGNGADQLEETSLPGPVRY